MPAAALLALAIIAEVLGTVALRMSDGFSRPLPSVGAVLGYALAFALLAPVLKELDIGLVYAIWAGVGTALIAVIGVLAWGEPTGAIKVLSIAAVILGVVGLNLSSGH
ncbi:MAG: DMT family transporter [Thermoleophilaceae bacterium]|jgi:small multidrug resistance pump